MFNKWIFANAGWISLRVQIKPHVETQSELNDGAFVSRNQRASFACVFFVHITTHYPASTNATDKKPPKRQIPPLTCDPRGHPVCTQRKFKQSLWLHYLSSSSPPLHPPVDTRSHRAEADRPGITHSLASEVPLSGDCWRKKENRSIHLPRAWQVIFTWDEIWVVPACWIP